MTIMKPLTQKIAFSVEKNTTAHRCKSTLTSRIKTLKTRFYEKKFKIVKNVP